MQAPHEFPRRILLCVTGLSPQLVTETLYALVHSSPPFMPTEIHIATTRTGAESARLNLLSTRPGWFERLRRDYALPEIAFDQSFIHILTDADGEPLDDIRTPEDNVRAADFITDFVRGLTADENCAVHASLAGGRKTMGFFLGSNMSLYGRAQDRMSHVLVQPAYETLPDFYYPTPYESISEWVSAGMSAHNAAMTPRRAEGFNNALLCNDWQEI